MKSRIESLSIRWMPLSLMIFACTDVTAGTIFPGEWVVVEFVFEEPPESAIGPVDFMLNQQGGTFADFSEDDYVDYFLYDGEALLSTNRTAASFCCHYRKEPSPWSPSNSIPIDFSSIMDGSINGVFIMKPFFNNPTQYSAIFFSDFHFITGTSIGPGMYWSGPDAVITSCRIHGGTFSTHVEIFSDGFENTYTRPC